MALWLVIQVNSSDCRKRFQTRLFSQNYYLIEQFVLILIFKCHNLPLVSVTRPKGVRSKVHQGYQKDRDLRIAVFLFLIPSDAGSLLTEYLKLAKIIRDI